MNFYPFFVHLDFAGFQDEATPFTPVDRIDLGYLGSLGIEPTSFEDWHQVGEWIRQFQKIGKIVPVGYNLRNLVWPALTMNLARAGESLPGLFMPMERKWNDLWMIDLQQLLVQGGYSDWKPSLAEACRFFGIDEKKPALDRIHDLYRIIQRAS